MDDTMAPYLPPAMLDARVGSAKGPFSLDDGVADLMRGAGCVDVSTTSIDLPVRFNDAEHWQAFSMSTAQRAMWAAVPSDRREEVRREAERRLEPARQPDGSFLVTQRVCHTTGRG